MTYPPYEELRNAQARRADVLENSARIARAYATYTVNGVGDDIILDKPFDFGLTFFDRPKFKFGPVFNDEESKVTFDAVPQCTACVHGWVQDDNGYWTGAYVGFAVSLGYYDATYVMDFDLEWTGLAFKDVLRDVEARLVD